MIQIISFSTKIIKIIKVLNFKKKKKNHKRNLSTRANSVVHKKTKILFTSLNIFGILKNQESTTNFSIEISQIMKKFKQLYI